MNYPQKAVSDAVLKTDAAVVSFRNMRAAIGILGMALPFVLIAGDNLIVWSGALENTNLIEFYAPDALRQTAQYIPRVRAAVSNYYYSPMGEVFTGVLITVAVFLFCYKGYPKQAGEKLSDNLITNLAAIFALGVVVFPTRAIDELNMRQFSAGHTANTVHLLAAALFLLSLAYMSFFRFARTNDSRDRRLHQASGLVMAVCLLVLGVGVAFGLADGNALVLVLETVALAAFGLSWQVKGKLYAKKEPNN